MKISEIMSENNIVLKARANNKRQLLQQVATKAAELTKADERCIFDALLERENLGSTGFGDRIAIPHCRLSGIDHVYGILFKLSAPIDFQAIDNKPVDIVFALFSPEDRGADHLTALAKVSRILKEETNIKKIRSTENAMEIFSILDLA